jgi:hypothetical protein
LWPNVSIVLLVFLAIIMATRKRFALVPLGSLALLLLFIVAGCGLVGGTGQTTNPNGTPAGTYPITVTGTSSGVPNQTVSITLIVT